MDDPTAEDLARDAGADLAEAASLHPVVVWALAHVQTRGIVPPWMDALQKAARLADEALPAWIRRAEASAADRDEYRRLALALADADRAGWDAAYRALRDHARGAVEGR